MKKKKKKVSEKKIKWHHKIKSFFENKKFLPEWMIKIVDVKYQISRPKKFFFEKSEKWKNLKNFYKNEWCRM